MCYALGSLEQATGVCPMCKVFKPVGGARCPHVREVCRNRAAHPRCDVVYLKNAEVQTFSGCGYCKWAATNPPQTYSGYQNPGWPGCCRSPKSDEQRLIGAADWPAVSLIHHIPIPPDVKAVLDSLTTRPGMTSPSGGNRATNVSATAPSMSRRSSYQVSSPTRAENAATRSAAMPISPRGRSGGSPQQATLALASSGSRHATANGDGSASSLPNRSAMDQFQGSRRSNAEHGEKRSDSTNSSQHSPGHRNIDLGGSVSRRSTERRSSVSNVAAVSVSKAAMEAQSPRRRTQTAKSDSPPPAAPATKSERPSAAPPPLKRATSTLEKSLKELNISSASSSSSGSTTSETTIISDGGFTDYLSDESEAELQRQAEVKAALLAQSQAEEAEFRVARQQLATVDLRPPKSWNGTNNATPRSQTSATRPPTYRQTSDYNMSSGKTSVAQGRS
ncbi:uncharacterized protein B0H18DRAFT_967759 [Fomitopsis serialis]|uniref:uncharacterized protein n=1 Tax=Fomitopsis serialis TaxID=139415 RepID=UPI00200788B0|nr:uncharacterized protein B0H18DRAFT_967759 [Neoantrodia serialis]KAH9938552.1 hypothetical protein B0H18DRAFT_967759 [Neoantrodia serialis]